MKILCMIICSVVLASQAFYLTPSVFSQEFSHDLSGVIYEQPSYFQIKDDNFLNPDNEILDFSDWTNRLYGRITLNLYYKSLKFISQTRPTLFSEDGEAEEFDFITDDAYLDMEIAEGYYIYFGKRNLRDVVAYGANPTDFMGEDKKVDFTKREEERRVERKGNYIVGTEAFLKNLTLSATYAPKLDEWQEDKDRVLLKANYFAETINTDMSLHLFYGEIPGVGFDLSSTVSDNLVLHTESAARWGSNKDEITQVSGISASAPAIFQKRITELDDDSKVYANIVVGGSYTFDDGTNFICEYIYNGAGYSSSEWEELMDFIKANHDAYRSSFFTDLTKGNLADATDTVKFREMRKNYVFMRLSNSKLIENMDAQLVFMANADDMSFLIFPSLDYKAGSNVVIGLSATAYSGEDDSEFGMMYWNSEASLVLKYYF